jgi:hypothetical chaperone protein
VTEFFCGVDFGTSNSSVAIAADSDVRVLPIDPDNDSPTSLPSLLYIARDGDVTVGRAAANTFIERNVDREVIVRAVELGVNIEGYVGGELDNDYGLTVRKEGDENTEVVTARAMVEVNAPGRLFQSLKTSLRHTQFRGTEVFGTLYQIEELTAAILRRIKETADEAAGRSVESAVFGRPVRFSFKQEEDALAERRLETAAHLAGFKNVTFFYEPVAACIEYAIRSDKKQKLMVVDIGGGTFDVCIMEFGGSGSAASRLADSKILSVAGVPVAGDAIDHEIIRRKVFPSLGSRARYGPSKLRLPQYVFNAVIDWQNMYRLNTEETINWLIAAEVSSDQPESIRALRTLIQRNCGYPLAREVEAAKKRLSDVDETEIEFLRPGIELQEHIERQEFTHIIEHMLDQMLESMRKAESEAGVNPEDLDFVLTTGGTSLIPAVRQMLSERYGADRLHHRDTFTSVATGLAVVARYA